MSKCDFIATLLKSHFDMGILLGILLGLLRHGYSTCFYYIWRATSDVLNLYVLTRITHFRGVFRTLLNMYLSWNILGKTGYCNC